MSANDIYVFQIDAYAPETIPMVRLATYLLELAKLFGEPERVHFDRLAGGSTKVYSRVEREAVPKVRNNLDNAVSGDEKSPCAKAYKALNELLYQDNADAGLYRNDAPVLRFPGRHQLRPPKLGPFTQEVVKDGMLVRIGGKDKTAHATLEDSDGDTWSFEVTRILARELAPYLFGQPIRLIGHARWFRDETGQWQHQGLKADRFHVLDTHTLAEVVARIRGLPQEAWKSPMDSMALVSALRDDEEETG